MKRKLTALTVAVSFMASGASAFELNTTPTEENRIAGDLMIGDLTVGVKALIYAGPWVSCGLNGKLYLLSSVEIESEPSDYGQYYKIQLEPEGEFTMTYGPMGNGDKDLPYLPSNKCSDALSLHPDETLIPVKSINGFKDRRSFIIDLINKGYE